MSSMFQVSDLAGARRREFLDAARRDAASLRDTDGSVLVMLTARRIAALTEASSMAVQLFAAEAAFASGEKVAPAVLGALAWLAEFDDDDRQEALAEIRNALALTVAHADPEPLRETLHAWQTTALAMRDPQRRAVLSSSPNDDDFTEVVAPTDA